MYIKREKNKRELESGVKANNTGGQSFYLNDNRSSTGNTSISVRQLKKTNDASVLSVAPAKKMPAQTKASASKKTIQRVKFETDDIHGFESLRQIIHHQLELQHINPAGTLFVSVGSSPVVFTNYLETKGARVVYAPMSGLTAYGKVYDAHTRTYGSEHGYDRHVEDRGADIFHQTIAGNLTGVHSIVVVDFGTSGGSNRAAYEIVRHYLNQRHTDVPVRMATLVRPGTEATEDISHPHNLVQPANPGLENEAVKRVLWVMHHQIDKQFSPFQGKYYVSEHIKGSKPPEANRQRLADLNTALTAATVKYREILKRSGSFVPKPNTLNLVSDKSQWVQAHRKTLLEKIRPSNKTLFALMVLLFAIVLFFWDAIFSRFKQKESL